MKISVYYSLFIILFISLFFISASHSYAQSFVFGAAGDYANGSNMQATVNAVKANGVDFHITLGDGSYSSSGEQSWCQKWQDAGISDLMMIAGNHDTGESSGGNIDEYIAACPHSLAVTGTFGKQYYFDYPQSAPLARFIMIPPDVAGSLSSLGSTYDLNEAGYNFTANAIDDARAKGIKWVIVGMHKNYITPLEKSNEIGSALIPMLINKRVDLILQGHEHGYARTKQLTCARINTYDASCVIDSDNSFVAGAGSIINILGTGGQGLRGLNTADSEYPYFASANNTAYGFGKFTVSSSQISYTFVRSAGGSLSDSFTISASQSPTGSTTPTSVVSSPTASPNPTATRTPTPGTPSPTRTPTPILPSPTSPTSPMIQGDANRDGRVDLADINMVLANFGRTLLGGSPVPTAPVPTQNQLSFNAVDDAFVRSDFDTSNYGTAVELRAVGTPDINSYLKFTVTGLAGRPRMVKMRLFVTDASPAGGEVYLVSNNYVGSTSPWTESGLIFTNAPAISGSPLSVVGAADVGTWVEFDVTGAITGNGTYSFALSSVSTNSVLYSSSEAASNQPVLVVTP